MNSLYHAADGQGFFQAAKPAPISLKLALSASKPAPAKKAAAMKAE